MHFLREQLGSEVARHESTVGRATRARGSISRWIGRRGVENTGSGLCQPPRRATVTAGGTLHSRTKKGIEWVLGDRADAVAMGSSCGHVFIWDVRESIRQAKAHYSAGIHYREELVAPEPARAARAGVAHTRFRPQPQSASDQETETEI